MVGLTERARPGVVGPLNAGTRAIVIVREESRRVEPTRRLDLRRVRCLGPKAFARWFGVRKIVRGGSNRFSSISLPSTKGPPTPRTAYTCCARQGNPALINQVVQARQEVSGFLHLIRRSSACRDGRHLLAFQCRWRLTNVERRHCAELSLLRRPSATDGFTSDTRLHSSHCSMSLARASCVPVPLEFPALEVAPTPAFKLRSESCKAKVAKRKL